MCVEEKFWRDRNTEKGCTSIRRGTHPPKRQYHTLGKKHKKVPIRGRYLVIWVIYRGYPSKSYWQEKTWVWNEGEKVPYNWFRIKENLPKRGQMEV